MENVKKEVLEQNNDVRDAILNTEEDKESLRLFNLVSKKNEIDILSNKMKEQTRTFIDNDELSDYLDSVVDSKTEEEIEALTNEQLDKIYTYNDAPIEIDLFNECTDEERKYKFKRDFLTFLKTTTEANRKFDEERVQIEAEIAESQEELDKLLENYANVTNYIRSRLGEKLESETDPKKKKLIAKLLEAYDNGLELNNIIDYAKSLNRSNLMYDFKNESRAITLHKKYLSTISQIAPKAEDLAHYADLEVKFLPEKYHEYNNMFVFTVIKYLAYKKDRATKFDGVFTTNLGISLKDLYRNNFALDKDRETFINAIQTVLDTIFEL